MVSVPARSRTSIPVPQAICFLVSPHDHTQGCLGLQAGNDLFHQKLIGLVFAVDALAAAALARYTRCMLQLSGMLLKQPILSLRTSAEVAVVQSPIINPNNLKIEGFYCVTSDRNLRVLLEQDIRDALPQGIVIND